MTRCLVGVELCFSEGLCDYSELFQIRLDSGRMGQVKMYPKDLREFIEQVDCIGQLAVVEGAECNVDIGPLTEMASEKNGPALLFDNIPGFPKGFRVLSNIYSTTQRTAIALGLPLHLDQMEIIKEWRKKRKEFTPLFPREVASGPVCENVLSKETINLYKLPAPKWHERDGGNYIGTGTAVVLKDPETGIVNVGAYRVMVHDEKTVSMWISPGRHGSLIMQKYHEKGIPCPVVVLCGEQPSVFLESAYTVPQEAPGFGFAGWLQGDPIECIVSEASGLPIPANSEIALEGEIPPGELRLEGPFAEWRGYYSIRKPAPIVRVNVVRHRNDPINHGSPPLKPPLKCEVLAVNFISVPDIWDALEAAGVPDVQGVWVAEESSMSMVTVVSIKQRYAGHAMQAAMVAGGCRGGAYTNRYVIVVDEDIDITDPRELWWSLATRTDPESSINIIKDCWSSPGDMWIPVEDIKDGKTTNTKAIIIACKPFHRKDQYPMVNRISKDVRLKIQARWDHVLGHLWASDP